MRGILLIGAGALARDIIDVFGVETFVAAYVDPSHAVAAVSGLPVVTSWEAASRRASHYVLGVSDMPLRERARQMAAAVGLRAAPAMVSPLARLAADAQLAAGCMVGHFVVIGPAASVGEDSLLMHGAILAHDARVEAGGVICAGACINGNVHLGPRCFVGPNAVLAPKIRLGHDCVVAAGAACFRDAPPHSLLVGNPARKTSSPPGA